MDEPEAGANLIMDNLLAENKCKPFIIVCTYGMTNSAGMMGGGMRRGGGTRGGTRGGGMMGGGMMGGRGGRAQRLQASAQVRSRCCYGSSRW